MPQNRQSIEQSIANLRSIIDASASSTSVDGETTNFDLERARQRLMELESDLAALDKKKSTRPSWFSMNMQCGPE